jgi:hypothetical protein
VLAPTEILYNHGIPESIRLTYVLLRGLAWGLLETPPLTMDQLMSILNKKQSAIYKHMAVLRRRGALLWHPAGHGTFIVSFPDDRAGLRRVNRVLPQAMGSLQSVDSTKMESPILNHINNKYICLNKEEDSMINGFHDPGKPLQPPGRSQNKVQAPTPFSIYQGLTGLALNPSQRGQVSRQVNNLELWQATIEHWLVHGWKPRNLPGLLNFYTQGGPDSCKVCRPRPPSPQPSQQDASDQRARDRARALAAIQQARQKAAARKS